MSPKMLDKATDRHADFYHHQVTEALLRHLERIWIGEVEQDEMNRLSYHLTARRCSVTTLPDDIRKTAHQLATSYHHKSLGEDLTTAIGKALLTELLRCWASQRRCQNIRKLNWAVNIHAYLNDRDAKAEAS